MKETIFTLRVRAAKLSKRKIHRITRSLLRAAIAEGDVSVTMWGEADRVIGHWVPEFADPVKLGNSARSSGLRPE